MILKKQKTRCMAFNGIFDTREVDVRDMDYR